MSRLTFIRSEVSAGEIFAELRDGSSGAQKMHEVGLILRSSRLVRGLADSDLAVVAALYALQFGYGP